uniref:DUF659 domain-containing protein n=1 Tax=Solanum lycopersicum TaxID=4081 RepID=A0A3Q7HLN4_SOLLC
MTENNITDKGQSQTDESKLRKEGKKYLMRGIIFLVKLILMEKEQFANTKEHGTTSMLTHIVKFPKMPYNIDIKQSKLAFQLMIGGNKGDVVVVPWKFYQEECRKVFCCIEGLKQFMKVAQPYFHIPSSTTVTRHCFDLFDEEKHKLMDVLYEIQQRVSLITNTWTSIQRINYMVVTSHWID